MKQIIILFVALLCTSLSANNEKKQKVESEIDKVTVFLKGAQITRSAQLQIPSGRSEIEFIGLSNKINAQSIQVTCEGEGVILDVKTMSYYADEINVDSLLTVTETSQVESLKTALASIEDDLMVLQAERSILEAERSQIYNNPLLKKGSDSIPLLKEGFEYFETKYVDITKRLIQIKHQEEDLQERKIEKNKAIQAIFKTYQPKSSNRNFNKIMVTFDSEKASSFDFTLSYLVNGAHWKPSYDIRTEGIEEDLTLMYKGDIQQSTGVDWTDVNLSVSMGNPYQNNNRPKIYPEYIDFVEESNGFIDNGRYGNVYNNVYINGKGKSGKGIKTPGPAGAKGIPCYDLNGNGRADAYEDTNRDGVVDAADCRGPAGATGAKGATGAQGPQGPQGAIGAQGPAGPAGATGATGLTGAQGPSGPAGAQGPAGAKGKASNRKDLAQTIEGDINIIFELDRLYSVPSDYQNHTVLLKTEEVPAEYTYYAVPKKDNRAYLLAKVKDWGSLNLLKGKANLFANGTYVGQTEIDPSTLTEYLLLSLGADDKVSLKRHKLEIDANTSFFGGSQTEIYNYEILVRNNRSQAIQLELLDQIPLSHNEEIEIILEKSSDGKYNKDYGRLIWNVEIPPNKTKDIKFSYSVKHPSNKRLTGF